MGKDLGIFTKKMRL